MLGCWEEGGLAGAAALFAVGPVAAFLSAVSTDLPGAERFRRRPIDGNLLFRRNRPRDGRFRGLKPSPYRVDG